MFLIAINKLKVMKTVFKVYVYFVHIVLAVVKDAISGKTVNTRMPLNTCFI